MGFLDRMKAAMTRVHFTYLGGHPDISKQQIVGIEREGDNVNLYSSQKDDPIATIPLATIKSVKLNRFARNRADSITYKTLLRNKGIGVISINEPIDDSPIGHLIEGVIESID